MQRSLYVFIFSSVLLAFLAGIASSELQWYPGRKAHEISSNIAEFLNGHEEEQKTTALEKAISDWGGIPYRHLEQNIFHYPVPEGAKGFVAKSDGFFMAGFHHDAPEGYVLLSAFFNPEGLTNTINHGLVLVSTKGEFIRYWLEGGSMGVQVDVQRRQLISEDWVRSWCSPPEEHGIYRMRKIHHTVEIAPDGTYWSNRFDGFVQFDPDQIMKNGQYKVLRTISFEDIIKANDAISPMTARRKIRWNRLNAQENEFYISEDMDDPYHQNDVQPFVDPRYPTKLGYALAVSLRNQNLIMILDPETLKIMWYAQGVTEYQHDVDYYKGYLYAYDNGIFRHYSRLIRFPLDPKLNPAMAYEVVVDGREQDWFQPVRGFYEIIPAGDKLYYLYIYGRRAAVVMLNEKGEQVFVLQNLLNTDNKHGIRIRAVQYLTPKEYAYLEAGCKAKK